MKDFFVCVCCSQPFPVKLMSPEMDGWCIHCQEGYEFDEDFDDEDYG